MIAIGILGPLSVTVRDAPVELTAAKVRIVLASLVLQPGHVVSADELTDRLWGDTPPRGARNALQTYVKRLRIALGQAGMLIRTRSSGYLIDLPPDAVDLARFRDHVARGRDAAAAGDLSAAAQELSAGLALWRGQPMSDIPSAAIQRDDVPRLVEEQLAAAERRIDIDLRLGRHTEVLGELRVLIDRHPLHEPLWELLMVALHRSGRQADALAAYRDLTALLRGELGVDPSAALRRRHQLILTGTSATADAPARRPEWDGARFQLPGDVANFIGRADLVGEILAAVTPSGSAVPPVILSGPPGVGKTALAVHVAHRLRPVFPDGQLYVNLRGFSQSPPVPATDALAQFLGALGVAAEHLPASLDQRSTLFRSLLADRRVLLVLDNASNADQVRPLLPGHLGCAVLVTSRDMLSGLSAVNGARRIPVDPVTTREAVSILATIVGHRVSQEPGAAVEMAAACGYLPLALRIGAANLAAMPGRLVSSYVSLLRSEDRLSALAVEGDDIAAVGRAFDLSYATLSAGLARTFRYLGLVPGPDFDAHTVANVAEVDLPTARSMLHRLATANLIQNHAADRYQFHDLIQEYARGRCLRDDDAEARSAAYRRLFDYHLHTADRAARVLHPDVPRLPMPPLPSGVVVRDLAEFASAFRWFEYELANLEAIIRETATAAVPVWLLVDAVQGYLDRQWLHNSLETSLLIARSAAHDSGEVLAEAAMCRGMGKLYFTRGRYPESREQYLRARSMYRDMNDPIGEARVLNGLGSLESGLDDFDTATSYWNEAVAAHRAAADSAGEADTRSNLGTAMVLLGRAAEGEQHLTAVLDIASRLGLHHIRPRALSAIALNDLWCGRLEDAARGLAEALEVWRGVGYRTGVAQTLRNLAEVHLETEEFRLAEKLANDALDIAVADDRHWNIAGAQVTLGRIALASADDDAASSHFRRAMDMPPAGLRYWHAFALLGMASCHRMHGHNQSARDLAGQALRDPRPKVHVMAHHELASQDLDLGDLPSCSDHIHSALEISRRCGYRLDEARALEVRAHLHLRTGDPVAAEAARAEARSVFRLARTWHTARSVTAGVEGAP